MLQFFRKHQKFFFVIVAFFIVISFSFFGTFSTFMNRDEIPDREIGQLVDGSRLKERKLHGMMRLLQYGVEEGGRGYNLLNGSVVHKDILLTGIGQILADHYYDDLYPELEAKWSRMKQFHPYVHPYAPYISAQNIWGQFAPQINAVLEELANAPEEFSKELLPLFFKLYAAQADYPTPLLHQMLYYQQQQGDQVRPDPGLPQANMALFGFQSVEDWFGATFVEEVSKFILNAACIARQEGYMVKQDEVQLDLFKNVFHSMKLFTQGKEPSSEEAHQTYTQQIRYLGLSEKETVDLWSQVMVFQRMFHEVGDSVLLDRLAFDQFTQFAKPSNKICRYMLPHELQFTTFRQLLKFQRYLEVAYEGDYTGLPTKMKHPEKVMNQFPQLAYKMFEVEVGSLTLLDILARVSLKQTWDWESNAENFAKVQSEFPQLGGKVCNTVDERMQALEQLDERTRFNVDHFARHCLVKQHPEWIAEALAKAPMEKQTLKISLQGDRDLSGAYFLALLETDDPKLTQYTSDNHTYYAVNVLEKGVGWNLLTYREALEADLLDDLLDHLLQTAYSGFEMEEAFEDVKDEVGAKIYKDVLTAIFPKKQPKNLDEYALHRFDTFLETVQKLAADNEEKFKEFLESSPWSLDHREETLARETYSLDIGEFSPVANASFYQLLDQGDQTAGEDEIAVAKQHLGQEAKQELMRKLLKQL